MVDLSKPLHRHASGRPDPLAGSACYQKQRDLGGGSFGWVALYTYRNTRAPANSKEAQGVEVAVKFIDATAADWKLIRREVQSHRLLRHPHCVKLREVGVLLANDSSPTLYLALEYADQGDLLEFLRRRGPLPEAEARWLFQQLIIGLDYCHLKGVYNRDIKPENLLLKLTPEALKQMMAARQQQQQQESQQRAQAAAAGSPREGAAAGGRAAHGGGSPALGGPPGGEASGPLPRTNHTFSLHLKIADFGLAKKNIHSLPKSRVGTVCYMAPEVLIAGPAMRYDGRKADIWSAGVVLYAMLFSRTPFEVDPGGPETAHEHTTTMRRILLGDWAVPRGFAVSGPCLDLLQRMLVLDPGQRATTADILAHPWFQVGLPAAALTMNAALVRQQAAAAATPGEQSEEEVDAVLAAGQTAALRLGPGGGAGGPLGARFGPGPARGVRPMAGARARPVDVAGDKGPGSSRPQKAAAAQAVGGAASPSPPGHGAASDRQPQQQHQQKPAGPGPGGPAGAGAATGAGQNAQASGLRSDQGAASRCSSSGSDCARQPRTSNGTDSGMQPAPAASPPSSGDAARDGVKQQGPAVEQLQAQGPAAQQAKQRQSADGSPDASSVALPLPGGHQDPHKHVALQPQALCESFSSSDEADSAAIVSWGLAAGAAVALQERPGAAGCGDAGAALPCGAACAPPGMLPSIYSCSSTTSTAEQLAVLRRQGGDALLSPSLSPGGSERTSSGGGAGPLCGLAARTNSRPLGSGVSAMLHMLLQGAAAIDSGMAGEGEGGDATLAAAAGQQAASVLPSCGQLA